MVITSTAYKLRFNSLKPNTIQILFQYSLPTAKKAEGISITKNNWLMPFKEITAVSSEKSAKLPVDNVGRIAKLNMLT
jgi:hypothetical protein